MTNRLLIIFSFFFLTNCSDEKPADIVPDGYTRIDTNIVDTINYVDFKFSKVIAFATVNPFDPYYLYGKRKMIISEFGDTISRTLDKLQTDRVINILNGKSKKDTLAGGADCHNPRHNIVFLNESDSVLNYVSVCFECHTIISTKEQKGGFIAFEDFFNSIGLKVFDRADYYKVYYDSIAKLRPNRKILAPTDTVKFNPPTEKKRK